MFLEYTDLIIDNQIVKSVFLKLSNMWVDCGAKNLRGNDRRVIWWYKAAKQLYFEPVIHYRTVNINLIFYIRKLKNQFICWLCSINNSQYSGESINNPYRTFS